MSKRLFDENKWNQLLIRYARQLQNPPAYEEVIELENFIDAEIRKAKLEAVRDFAKKVKCDSNELNVYEVIDIELSALEKAAEGKGG